MYPVFRRVVDLASPVRIVGVMLLWGALGLVACGPGSDCTKDGDCLRNSDFGKGFACIQQGEVKKCIQRCPTSCDSAGDCSRCANGRTACVNGTCQQEQGACPSACTSDSDCSGCPDSRTACVGGVCDTSSNPVCPSSCSNDGECSGCASGNTSCISGTCGKPAPTCPDSCQQDSDCASCPDGKTTCKENQCASEAPPQCPSSCTSDGDCAKCPNARTTCDSNGKCVEKFNPQCPSSCTSDGDCAKCDPGKQKCTNGACNESAPQCPSSCTADGDCAKCPDGKTSCEGGVCAPKATPNCPSSCNLDSECAKCPDGRTICTNQACVKPPQCPSSCTQDSDCFPCPSGQKTCTNGSCGAAPPQCPSSCSVNTDCSKCPDAKNFCVSGSCGLPTSCPSSCTDDKHCAACGGNYECKSGSCQKAQPPLTGPGQICDNNNRCRNGEVCITIAAENKSYCFQDCSSSATSCAANAADGRTQCVAMARDSQGNTISVCLGESDKGKACGFGVQAQKRCKTGLTPPLYCNQKSLCQEAVLRTKVGETCSKSTDKTDPRRVCDLTKNLICDEKTGKCATVAFAKEGEDCDVDGKNLGKIVLCDRNTPNLTCITFNTSGSIARCHRTCNTSTSGQCTHRTGLKCEPLLTGGRGLCMDTTCTTDRDCAFSGYECQTQSSGKLCVPPPPVGPKKYGEVCTPNGLRSESCQANLLCLTTQTTTKGFCSPSCTSTCQRTPTGQNAQCVTLSGGGKACIILCGTGNRCPPQLSCDTSTRACLPP